ncbi:MAG: exodeoxyribonuclease VII large subunit [Deltaproteobacteria bacterium]|nr:exodeoxyribonuclease VII large subunit [Deltaproteobacteria bacterium]
MNFSDQKIYTPSQVGDLVQFNFDAHIGQITLAGEVGSLATPNSGHVYLEIKDKAAMVKGVIWRASKHSSGVSAIQTGMMVQARGRLRIYGPRSEYQLNVEKIMPMGEGALSLAFEKLKKKLGAEGLFAPERKRPIPETPRRVVLVGSAGSAAVNDFLTTSVKRRKGAWISLFPTRVQGKGAAEEMAEALSLINSRGDFDLVVMTRGGGSLEDLWSYNEEVLVRAVANSRLPILAAIGHSTDLSLVEMAADAKAITPTAAAEAVFALDSERLGQVKQRLNELKNLTKNRILVKKSQLQSQIGNLGKLRYKINYFSQLLDSLLMKLENSVKNLMASSRNKLATLTNKLEYKSPYRDQIQKRQTLERLSKALLDSAKKTIGDKRQKLRLLTVTLDLVSPKNTLKRGYAVVAGPDGRVLHRAALADLGQKLQVLLAEGRLLVEVLDKDEKTD